jgi:hypothetical protein
MVTFSHRQGDRGTLCKFTKPCHFFSPAGRSSRFTQVYKTMSLFLTDRAIGGIYTTLQKMVTFSHRQGDRGWLFFNSSVFSLNSSFTTPRGFYVHLGQFCAGFEANKC